MDFEALNKTELADMSTALCVVDRLLWARSSEMFFEEGIQKGEFAFADNDSSVKSNTSEMLGRISKLVEGLEKGELKLVKA